MESRWLRQFGPDTSNRTPLICFPHAGGAASAYVPLARALAPALNVLAVQYPGRQDRRKEAPVESVTGLADRIADELRPHADQPYAFFGHSMGASVAYETARRLGPAGPRCLLVSGRGAPSSQPKQSDQLHGDQALLAEMRRLGGTGSQILDDPELLDMILPPLRADYRALASYRWTPGPPLDCPIFVLVGDSDPVVSVGDASGWLEHSTAGGDVRTFPGGHFYLESNIGEVAETASRSVGAHLVGPSPVITTSRNSTLPSRSTQDEGRR